MQLTTQTRTNKDTRNNARILANYLKGNNFEAKQPTKKDSNGWNVRLSLTKQHKRKGFVVINGAPVQENLWYVGRG